MNEDFSEIVNKFSDILKEKNIDLNNITSDGGGSSPSPQSVNNFDLDIDTILKIKDILSKINSNQNCPRNQLLNALKPYLEPSKKDKLDQYMKIANIIGVLDSLELGTNFFNDNKKGYDFILIITLFLLII
jgi:hypothetical protein